MNDWKVWAAGVGGVVAIVGQFWGANYYLPLIGGALALISAIGSMTN
ncbi:MAG TPA: hypothetical protein VJZ93_00170 [Candidatus Nanoarchaeia archaeon]|nr:hypothetical protein [Candidatus Nanoarchaeia archaeon]